MATKTKKSRKNVTNAERTRDERETNAERMRDERETNAQQVRFAYAPILQQFRAHTRKNEARLWIPIETSLIFRYEFAACSLQTRYIFVAILLYCAGNGIDEIPLDARFMSNVLNADYRTIEKSFDELLSVNLLQERKEKTEKKEQTHRQDERETAPEARVSVSDFNSFSETDSEVDKTGNADALSKEDPAVNLSKKDFADDPQLAKISEIENAGANHSNVGQRSKFSIEECLKYVELCKADGDAIANPKALANHLSKTGEADALIFNKLFPKEAELMAAQSFGEAVKFSGEPCRVCFGAKMSDAEGKGFRACNHCKNERGKSTGYEPEGENE